MFVCMPPLAAAHDTGLVERAESLLRADKASEAFDLLSAQEILRAGEARFDYALALAALGSGRAGYATVVLERLLAVDPGFAGARIDIGRAYFQLGDYARAKTAFDSALNQDPPPAARATIAYYLEEIRHRQRSGASFTGQVETSLGKDTDVNNATSQSQISVPGLGNMIVSLNPVNLKTAARFAELAGRGEATLPLDEEWSAYAGVDGRYRRNMQASSFNFGNTEMRAGLSRTNNDDAYRFGLSGGEYVLGGTPNRIYAGIDGEWRMRVSKADLVSFFGQHLRHRFPSPQLVTNGFDQSALGIGWSHLPNDSRSLFSIGMFVGNERATDNRSDGNKYFNGFRLGGETRLAEEIGLFANLGWQHGWYDRVNPAFMQVRRYTQSDMTVGINWSYTANWSLRGQATRILNATNLVIYQYDRNIGSLTLRYDFR